MEIVRVQVVREQYHVTIPKVLAIKAKLKKGTPMFITLEDDKIVLVHVKG